MVAVPWPICNTIGETAKRTGDWPVLKVYSRGGPVADESTRTKAPSAGPGMMALLHDGSALRSGIGGPAGARVASGVYFIAVQAGGTRYMAKLPVER